MKKVYFVSPKDEEGFAVIAETPSQAKTIVYGTGDLDCEWIELRTHIIKDEKKQPIQFPPELTVGHIFEPLEGLEVGAYGYVEYLDCPICNNETLVKRFDDGSVMCNNCYEEQQEI